MHKYLRQCCMFVVLCLAMYGGYRVCLDIRSSVAAKKNNLAAAQCVNIQKTLSSVAPYVHMFAGPEFPPDPHLRRIDIYPTECCIVFTLEDRTCSYLLEDLEHINPTGEHQQPITFTVRKEVQLAHR